MSTTTTADHTEVLPSCNGAQQQVQGGGTEQQDEEGYIQAIDSATVHRICSGQVVLTLAVAVKELVENSLDAGATSIDVRVKNCGTELIEVTDNGCGVRENNFEALTLKHHTSKLKDFSDLSTGSVFTFGFRGEALSSLCALGDLTIHTRHSSEHVGHRLSYAHSGRLRERERHARPVGTSVTLANLFSTLPVRRQEFVRNSKREFSKMVQLLYGYCLITTTCRITCTHTDEKGRKSVVVSSGGSTGPGGGGGVSEVRANISAVFGTKQLSSLLELRHVAPCEETCAEFGLTSTQQQQSDVGGVTVRGFVSSCQHGQGRSSQDRQFLFINGRPCEFPRLARVINDTYHQYNRHQQPFVCVDVSIAERDGVDINVTPDKRQILVEREGYVLACVRESLTSLYEHAVPSQAAAAGNGFTPSLRNFYKSAAATAAAGSESQPRPKLGVLRARASLEENRSGNGESGLDGLKGALSAAFKRCHSSDGTTSSTSTSTCSTSTSTCSTSTPSTRVGEGRKQRRLDEGDCTFITVTPTGREGRQQQMECRELQVEHCQQQVEHCQQQVEHSQQQVEHHQQQVEHRHQQVEYHHQQVEDREQQAEHCEQKVELCEQHTKQYVPYCEQRLDGDEQKTSFEAPCFSCDGDVVISDVVNNNAVISDAVISDAVISDTVISDAVISDAVISDAVISDAVISDAVISDAVSSDAVTSDATDSIPSAAAAFGKREVVVDYDWDRLLSAAMSASRTQAAASREEGLERSDDVSRGFHAKITARDNERAEQELRRHVSKETFMEMEVIGQFNLGFIITSVRGRDLFIIDQHASDEKYNYERLQRDTHLHSQSLIHPQPLHLTAIDEHIVIDHLDVFTKNGFGFNIDQQAEPTKRVSLVSVPVSGNHMFGKPDVEELIFLLSDTCSAAAPTSAAATPTPAAATPTSAAATPTPAAATPTSAAATPTSAAATPTSVAATPTSAAGTPTSAAATPTSAAATPTPAAATPTSVAATPTSVATMPTSAAATPTSVATMPTSAAGTPTSAAAAPTSAATTPTSAAATPTSAAAAPTSAAAAPTSAAGTPTSAAAASRRCVLRPSRVSQMFASRACRGSVMVGTPLDHGHMASHVRHMADMDNPWCCPHGRPTLRHLFNVKLLPHLGGGFEL